MENIYLRLSQQLQEQLKSSYINILNPRFSLPSAELLCPHPKRR